MNNPKIRKLKNGVTLLLSENKSTDAVSLVVYIGAGSRYEDERTVGMTHFLEHILFDGTKSRPTSLAISKEIDALGAEVNAHPTEEYTNFHIKCAAEHLPKVTEIFSDMLLNSRVSEADIKKEKKVIAEEIKMRTDIAPSYIFSVFDQALFAGNALGRYTGGTIQTVENIERKDILDFYNQYYLGSNIAIAVCGNFAGNSADQISSLIESKFSFSSSDANLQKSLDFKPEKLKFLAKDSQQTNIIAGYPGSSYASEDRFGLKLLSTILGGNMSSRMFTEIREKQGLAYDVRTYHFSVSDTGSFLTHAGVADEKAAATLKEILHQHEKIKTDLSSEELETAKSYILGQLKIAFEDSYELADFYLTQFFHTGKIETLSEISEKIAKIKVVDIKNLAKKYLSNDKLSVAVIAKESVRAEIEKVINSLSGAK